jgi:xanthine/uracil/vitamin C permease (AzgA family)
MFDFIFGDRVSGDWVCAWTAKVEASAIKRRSLIVLIIGYLTVRILVQGEEKENVLRVPLVHASMAGWFLQVSYQNGQNSGTSQITIANTAIVRIEPTFMKSKKRYCPGV